MKYSQSSICIYQNNTEHPKNQNNHRASRKPKKFRISQRYRISKMAENQISIDSKMNKIEPVFTKIELHKSMLTVN